MKNQVNGQTKKIQLFYFYSKTHSKTNNHQLNDLITVPIVLYFFRPIVKIRPAPDKKTNKKQILTCVTRPEVDRTKHCVTIKNNYNKK